MSWFKLTKRNPPIPMQDLLGPLPEKTSAEKAWELYEEGKALREKRKHMFCKCGHNGNYHFLNYPYQQHQRKCSWDSMPSMGQYSCDCPAWLPTNNKKTS